MPTNIGSFLDSLEKATSGEKFISHK